MEIREYVARDGKAIFIKWWKKLGDGVHELRIHYGPGYRVYFGNTGKHIILLLCGGNKASQQQDVNRAKQYWQEYRRR